jgi:uncharacterized protein
METATEQKLTFETKKWLEKIKPVRDCIVMADESKKNFLDNIDAYISDSQYFLENGDYIEAFEAVIWAWAYIEIGKDIGILK